MARKEPRQQIEVAVFSHSPNQHCGSSHFRGRGCGLQFGFGGFGDELDDGLAVPLTLVVDGFSVDDESESGVSLHLHPLSDLALADEVDCSHHKTE